MLSIGYHLTDPNETLTTTHLAEVCRIVRTDSALQTEVLRLRKLATLDKTAYRNLKTRLPYVVGGVFEGGRRHTQHLQAAHFFILDFDDFPMHDQALRQRIYQHPSVALGFVSPSGQGLKVFVPLESPCSDTKLFSLAYRAFATQFANDVRLNGSLDLRTSDAARACFLSFDAAAYFNSHAEAVKWQGYGAAAPLPFDSTDPLAVASPAPTLDKSINEVAYEAVLRKINPNKPVRREKQLHVPDILHEIEPMIKAVCGQYNLTLVEIKPLNFGLKFMVKQGTRFAEVNVFYGKKGFSVLRSPKTGNDPTLSDLLYQSIYQLLFPTPIATDVPYTFGTNTN